MKKIFIYNISFIFLFIILLSIAEFEQVNAQQDTVASADTTNIISESLDSLEAEIKDTAVTDTTTSTSIKEIITSSKIILSIIIIILGFYAITLLAKVLNIFAEKSTNYRITLKGLVPVVRIIGWVIILYFIIGIIIKPPFETVIAVTASVGIAVGLAAQDILKNVFGGIMILFDRPFQVGDKILVGEYYGEVIKIGLRSTRVVTPDDSTVSIPNSEIMNEPVSNANFGEPNCQVVAEIYLPIDTDTEVVRQIAIEAAQVSKYVYLNKPITVLFFNEIKERRSYLKMRLKAYVLDIRYEFAFKSDMTEIVIRELLANGLISPEEVF